VGGNLTVLTHLVGTDLFPPLEGTLLMLEDVGERPYRLDRCLQHLRRAGALSGVCGVVFGDLTDCEPRALERSAREMIGDFCRELGLPAALGLGVGHGLRNRAIPLGAEVELDAGEGRLTFLEGAVA
jgi:muramoyltetrapeptide carboxypeptidase